MALNFPSSPSDGDIYQDYVWNATVGAWQSLSAESSIANIDDVSISAAEDGEVLKYNGTSWENLPVATNTDGDPGGRIFVGATDPSVAYTLAAGDVWIEVSV